jgi:hypothetical protein
LVVAVATTVLKTIVVAASIYVGGNRHGDDSGYCSGNGSEQFPFR